MSRLCLITALPAETRPLLDALKLRQQDTRHLRLYGSDSYLLLETGVGKLNAAATTSAVLTAYPDIAAVLNIGIAGGRFDYATVLAAHHVYDHATGAQWFPHLPAKAALRAIASARINTLDSPSAQYEKGVLFDMEASGIFSAASRYLSSSQIHSVKVVSDNAQHDLQHVSKQTVMQLMQQSLPAIMPILEVLLDEIAALAPVSDNAVEQTVNQALLATRHSVNDARQLKQLVLQYVALTNKQPTLNLHSGSAAKIRRQLQLDLKTQSFTYGNG